MDSRADFLKGARSLSKRCSQANLAGTSCGLIVSVSCDALWKFVTAGRWKGKKAKYATNEEDMVPLNTLEIDIPQSGAFVQKLSSNLSYG